MNDTEITGTASKIGAMLEFIQNNIESDSIIKPHEINTYFEKNYGWKIKNTTIIDYLEELSKYNLGIKQIKKLQTRKFIYQSVMTQDILILLSDIISSSLFLDEKSANELIYKIQSFVCKENKKDAVNYNSFSRPEMKNPSCLNNLKSINLAIQNHCFITYYQANTSVDGKLSYYKRHKNEELYLYTSEQSKDNQNKPIWIFNRKKIESSDENMFLGTPFKVFPYKMVWDNSRCYLICLKEFKNIDTGKLEKQIKCIRVDRMIDIKQCEYIESTPFPTDRSFHIFFNNNNELNVSLYMSSIFKMFKGKNTYVSLIVRNDMMRIIYEKFGNNFKEIPNDTMNNYTTVKVLVQVSKTFFGWLANYYPYEIKLKGPQSVLEEYSNHLKSLIESYE